MPLTAHLPCLQDDVPQFVIVMVDGAVNTNNYDFFKNLWNRKNSTGVKGTFFIQHEYCDYFMVEDLYVQGHEIALSSVSGQSLAHENVTRWREEIRTLKEILQKYANVAPEDILGKKLLLSFCTLYHL